MEFREALDILWRRRGAIFYVLLIGVLLGVAAFLLAPREYQATAQTMIVSSAQGRDPAMSNLDMPTLVQSETVIGRAEKQLQMHVPFSVIQSRISAKISLGSNVMPISYQDRNPRRAVLFTNALANSLVQYYREISATRYTELEKFLNNGMASQRARMEQLDRKLEEAAVKDPVIAQKSASQTISSRLLALQAQRAQIDAVMRGHQAQEEITSQELAQFKPLIDQELALRDPAYQALRAQQGKDAAQLQIDRSQYTDKYPGFPGLQEKVKLENDALNEAQKAASAQPPVNSATYMSLIRQKGQTDAVLAADRAQLTAIDQEIAQEQDHLAQIPGVGVKIAQLRRDRDAADAAYQAMAMRLTTTLADQAEAAALGSVVVIDPARRAESVVAKHAAVLIAGAVLGFLVLGITLAFLLEITDTRLRTPRNVEDLYGRPVIATFGRS